jgi:hypothetical protein
MIAVHVYKYKKIHKKLNTAQPTILIGKAINALHDPVLAPNTSWCVEQECRIVPLFKLIQAIVVGTIEFLLEVRLLDIRFGHVCTCVWTGRAPLAQDVIGEMIHLGLDGGIGNSVCLAGRRDGMH